MSKDIDMAEEYMSLNAAVEPLLSELSKDDDFMNTFNKTRGESVAEANGRCRALEANLVVVGDVTNKLKKERHDAELRLASRLGTVETMSQIVAETERLSRKLDGDRREAIH